jgi:hypothetical protein
MGLKKTIMLGYMLLIALSCRAQQIVPVERSIDYMIAGNGIPEGTYLKDTNNLLPKYLGTWKGTFEGKNYTFVVTKHTYKPNNVTYDILLIRYLITSSNGTVIEDTRNLPNDSPYVIKGYYFSKDISYYVSNYTGREVLCGQHGKIFIRIKNASNTMMSLVLSPDKDMISEQDCPGLKSAVQLFPIKGMMLTKQ